MSEPRQLKFRALFFYLPPRVPSALTHGEEPLYQLIKRDSVLDIGLMTVSLAFILTSQLYAVRAKVN